MQFSYLIFGYAAVLIIDSITFQILAPERDPSILTPLIFGGILILMGIMTLKKDLQLFGKHGAATLSLIAFISSLGNVTDLFTGTSTGQFYSNTANALMAVFSIIFLICAVIKFGMERNH